MKLSNIFLAIVLTVSAAVAHAESAQWERITVAGTDMFVIGNVSINCTSNPEDDGLLQHAVWIYGHAKVPPSQYDTHISFVINGTEYPVPPINGSVENENLWTHFIEAIGETTKFDVLINGKKVDSYTTNIKNVKKVLGNKFYGSCWNTHFQE